jgi:hypothetical protein
MPSEEHYMGARALGRLAMDSLTRLVHESKTARYEDREVEAKVYMIFSLISTYSVSGRTGGGGGGVGVVGGQY